MKPSPGPWRWDDGSDEGYALWDATKNLVLATYEPLGQPHKKDPQRVDTRTLIAAAPEMREMLLWLERSMDDREIHRGKPCAVAAGADPCMRCTLAALLERIR